MTNVGIIGLGEIGETVLRNMSEVIKSKKLNDKLFGVDVSEDKLNHLKKEGFNVGLKFDNPMDVYVVAVYTSDQVFEVLEKLDCKNKPLVLIESTLKPGLYKKILQMKGRRFRLALFPHRYYKPDPEHQVFNLRRVLAGENTAVTLDAMNFLQKYMDLNLIHTDGVTLEIAELCKPLENAYRFMEITIAEGIKMYCKDKKIDFDSLRKAMNTKWNINVLEPRDGVGGHCLPKDMKLINEFFIGNKLFKEMIKEDERYKEWLKNNK